ncbi:helix-turn-helix domain-containing protein [Eubacterium barkeri]|uniref:PucR C-terminal helix-turn-helix domain-containing protein n=1 Tax=Eubacterium barkeri TaxID=1528 RepID=A0A1H3F943_EUBBA|nr:helix-turn-helix domain-containing protein [Eubacterium barkeri]SDX87415.1 PucR C-terminal helix-turn-helix domain-containing protein [Eubacterium barkeri]
MELAKIYQILLRMMAEDSDIQKIVNMVTTFLDNPVVLVDANFRILSASTQLTPLNNDLWDLSIGQRYVSDEIIRSMQENRIIEALHSEEGEPIESPIPEGYSCLRMPLYCKGRYRGFLGVYDYNQPFKAEDPLILEAASQAVGIFVQNNTFFNAVNGSTYDMYLYELLQANQLTESQKICKRYKALSLGAEKVLIVLDTVDKKGQEVNLSGNNLPGELIVNRLKTLLPCHHSVVFKGSVVIVMAYDSIPERMLSTIRDTLQLFCETNQLIAGISMVYRDAERTFEFYRQARYAIHKSSGEIGLSYYQNVVIDAILSFAKESYPVDHYIHPAIWLLKDYDQRFNTHYLISLKKYLYCFGNKADTAAVLGLHYNSIKYRIKMIQEIAEINLKEVELKYHLYLSFRLLNMEDE